MSLRRQAGVFSAFSHLLGLCNERLLDEAPSSLDGTPGPNLVYLSGRRLRCDIDHQQEAG